MKRCPRCDRSFPDSETFCEADGTALVKTGPAFSESAGSSAGAAGGESQIASDEGAQIECPVCGGKAQPGELICNFCGARLGVESPAQQYIPPPPASSRPSTARASRDPSSSMRFTGKMPDSEDEKSGRGILGVIGYLLAAIIALGGGAWLALHLSSKGAEQPIAHASPAASPAARLPMGPSVALSTVMPIQVIGESASAPERNQDAARKYFEDHKSPLVESYSRALAGDGSLSDAMVLRVRILPNGNVDAASVRTSTNPNPGLDAEVVKTVSTWNYPPSSGGQVEVDYPIVFTNDPATKDTLESSLSSKLASLSPTEAPEFASAPGAAAPVVSEGAPMPPSAAASSASAAPVAPVAAPPPANSLPAKSCRRRSPCSSRSRWRWGRIRNSAAWTHIPAAAR
jgi:TonB family protein